MATVTLLACGCGTINTTSTRAEPSQDSVPSRTKVNDLLTQISLHAKDVRVFPTKGGPLKAQVDVANDGLNTRGFAYRFAWLNERGSVIESPMSVWMATSVPAGGSVMITSVAPDLSATDFSLQVRRSD